MYVLTWSIRCWDVVVDLDRVPAIEFSISVLDMCIRVYESLPFEGDDCFLLSFLWWWVGGGHVLRSDHTFGDCSQCASPPLNESCECLGFACKQSNTAKIMSCGGRRSSCLSIFATRCFLNTAVCPDIVFFQDYVAWWFCTVVTVPEVQLAVLIFFFVLCFSAPVLVFVFCVFCVWWGSLS